jgi:hypothetical protein
MSVRKDGSAPPETVLSGNGICGLDIAMDDQYLYWSDCYTVSRRDKLGGAIETLVRRDQLSLGVSSPIVTASAVFYWADWSKGEESWSSLSRLDKATGAEPVELQSHTVARLAVADANHLYWLGDNEIVKGSMEDDTTDVVAAVDSFNDVAGLAVDDDFVYWTDVSGDGSIWRAPK